MAISISLLADPFRRSRRLRVAAVAVTAVAAVAAGLMLSRSAVFDVRSVQVRGGSHLDRASVVELAAIAPGTSALWFDERAVERRLEMDPWVARATVTTHLPRSVDIEIVERRPVAIVVEGAARSLVAGDGVRLGRIEGVTGTSLPEILVLAADADVAGAARTIATMPGRVARSLERVVVGADGGLELRLSDGAVVRYGAPVGQERKAETLLRLLGWAARQEATISSFNVMAPGVPAVTYDG